MSQNLNRQAGRKGIAISTPLGIDELPNGRKRLQLVSSEWHRSRMVLQIPHGHNSQEIRCDGHDITTARNMVAKKAHEEGLRYLFFLDSDILTPPQTLARLVYLLDNNPDIGVACGLYTFRSDPAEPMVWTEYDNGVNYDWTVGDLVDVVGTGGGCMCIRCEVFDLLKTDFPTGERSWFKMLATERDTLTGDVRTKSMGEDMWFCRRVRDETAFRVVVDTSLCCVHFDAATGIGYGLSKDSAPAKRFIAKQKELQQCQS